MVDDIDAKIDAVLRAAGSSFRNYTMPASQEKLRAAMARIVNVEWRDISSAPWDTNLLLGWWDTFPCIHWVAETGFAGKSNSCPAGCGASNGWQHGYATHWLPLPKAPETHRD